MSAPSRGPSRARLRIESLEDRLVPASMAGPLGFDPHRVLVTFADASTDHTALLRESPLAAGVSRIGAGIYRLDLPAGTPVTTAVRQLNGTPGVLSAQPDYVMAASRTPSDPSFGGQWGLNRIGAPSAWNVATGTGQTVVAVIDTGVDYTHPDLAANIWRNPKEAANGIDDDGNGFVDDLHGADFLYNDGNPMDDAGHGTHVAGIIGAVGNNGVGVSGVAWTTRIMPLKFMSASGGYTSNAIRAIDYAVANGAKVINNSWGGGGADPALAAAIGRARAAGVIVVAAAGNYGADVSGAPFYPGSYSTQFDNMVTVAATTSSDTLAGFSNFGAAVTIAAPGSSILSTLPGGRYGSLSGTSMATPFVAGAVAQLWDANPGWSYQTVLGRLKSSAAAVPALAGKVAAGRLDVARMFEVSPPVPPVSPPPVSPPPPTGDGSGPRVVNHVFGGPRAGVFDRVWVQFSEPLNVSTFTPADLALSGPLGAVGVSAIQPIAGKNNTEFLLMFSRPQTTPGTYSLTLGPDVRDGAGTAMDQNRNGVAGEATDKFSASADLIVPGVPPVVPPPPPASPPPPPAPSPSPTRLSYAASGLPRAIQDRRTTRVELLVTDDFQVSDLNVQLNITHARTHDLNIRIVAPDGRSVTLFNRRGGANLSNTTFDDQASASLTSGSGSFSGSFRPEQLLAAFNGVKARGVWSVQVFDLASGVTGTVDGVTLSFASASTASSASQRLLEPADYRGASDPNRAAVLDGRPDVVAQPPRDGMGELADQYRPIPV